MGSQYADSLARSGSATIQVVIDANAMRAEVLAASVSSRASTRLEEAFEAEAAIVATPAPTHFLLLVRGEIDPDAERGGLLPPHRVAALVRSRAFGESSPSLGETVSVA